MSADKGNDREVTLRLSLDEVNLVLEAIGQLPFVRVYALVAKLQQQARQQIEGKAEEGGPDAR